MIHLLKRFFDDINRLANATAFPRAQDVVVTLSQEDRDLLANYRRRKPSVKQEVKHNMHSANSALGHTESL